MQASLTVPASKLRQFQGLVKKHDLRFLGNPILIGDRAHVCIDSDHLLPGGCNPFWADWNRINVQIREIRSPAWKRVLRKFGISV